jgi:hypothetical protein
MEDAWLISMFLKTHSPAGNADVRRYRGVGRAARNAERSEMYAAPCSASEGYSQSTAPLISGYVPCKGRAENPYYLRRQIHIDQQRLLLRLQIVVVRLGY